MRQPPSTFAARLQREFGGRLRIRWSTQRGEWQVEQKVARASVPRFRLSDNDDDAIRMWDGYDFLMAVREGDRMPCPYDGTTLKVPAMGTGEVTCTYCKLRGREGRYAAAYFPLDGDGLIQYLRRLDPILGWNRNMARDADRHNAAITSGYERAVSNTIEASTKEHWTQLVGIPHVGFTGREKAWER